MARAKKSQEQLFTEIWKTDFERFFHNGEWDRLLSTTMIPDSALTFPSAGPRDPEDMSWDRRAAWLLFDALSRSPTQKRIPEDPVEFLL